MSATVPTSVARCGPPTTATQGMEEQTKTRLERRKVPNRSARCVTELCSATVPTSLARCGPPTTATQSMETQTTIQVSVQSTTTATQGVGKQTKATLD